MKQGNFFQSFIIKTLQFAAETKPMGVPRGRSGSSPSRSPLRIEFERSEILQEKLGRLRPSFLLGLVFLWLIPVHANTLSPLGKWQTMDDETNLPRSIIEIREKEGNLSGKIKKVIYQPNEVVKKLCDKCPPPWQNKKIVGLTILWNLAQDPHNDLQWVNGKILDPKTGKIYKCQLTLNETGDELRVRGYIGMPLLGRTQKWLRKE